MCQHVFRWFPFRLRVHRVVWALDGGKKKSPRGRILPLTAGQWYPKIEMFLFFPIAGRKYHVSLRDTLRID